ncbi:hypothetical protein CALVIDRAFT_106781 [Calocera viscosa TUFC12733]|uniref:Uncharacterized protein n=1 Tax=Calocera viscosa (strain TUFC12733) TaxID=1330018 RepID=A0A167MB92_CALVF|nr:hypothetical protein CALVIDRAFT_106781 [Calocera viscosa TUFC12733]
MSAEVEERPAQRRRLGSPEIQITRQIIGGREVITIDDSDDEVQPVPQMAAQGPSRRRLGDRTTRTHMRAFPAGRDGRTRFEEMRRRQQVGEALTHRNRIQDIMNEEEIDFAVIPDDDDDDDDFVPDDDNRIFSPTPPPANNAPNRRRIALGGALFVQDGLQINLNLGERVNRYLAHLPLPIMGMGDLLGQAPPAIPAYKEDFTHPGAPPGVTHSFPASPPSPDRKGKSVNPPASINFQCTNCHDNLYLAAPDAKHRVYALRCGHLFDGQCVSKLSTPPAGIFPQTENIPVLGLEPLTRRGRGRGARNTGKAKSRGRKRKRGEEEKLTWDWACPSCQRAHVSEWDASAGERQTGAWVPHREEGAILLYL